MGRLAEIARMSRRNQGGVFAERATFVLTILTIPTSVEHGVPNAQIHNK